jgi:hypothetical protein
MLIIMLVERHDWTIVFRYIVCAIVDWYSWRLKATSPVSCIATAAGYPKKPSIMFETFQFLHRRPNVIILLASSLSVLPQLL